MFARLPLAVAGLLLLRAVNPVAVLGHPDVLAAARPYTIASPRSTPRRLPTSGFALGRRAAIAPQSARNRASSAVPLAAETFTSSATKPNAWTYGDKACLTAGNSETPTPVTSIPACGPNAPQDISGKGALELTPPANYNDGYVFSRTPLSTAGGISASFEFYSFNSQGSPGDGIAFVLTDASKPVPTAIAGCCGSLGYAPRWLPARAALPNGYLAVGFDESGYFTQASEGRIGGLSALLANSVTVRGAASLKAPYLFTTQDAYGRPASLPFRFTNPSATTRPTGLGMTVTLTSSGFLEVSVDRHDGNGPLVYVPPTQIVGRGGQPPLPANIFFGFTAAGGEANARHQITNLTVTSAPTLPAVKASVLTYHNDNNRTGWNSAETILTTSNVKPSTFGLLHTVAVDGRIDAQPLVVPEEVIDGRGYHDVVYVATENDSVYAIDAQSGAILQARNFGASISNRAKDYDDNIYPTNGISSTPVIDLANHALYIVTETNESPSAPDVFRLHRIALNNLADAVPSVVLAPATILSDGSVYRFPAQHERQRPGLLEANGTIYVAFGSTGDTSPAFSRGIIAGFRATDLAPLASNVVADRLGTTANRYYLTSIWQSGYGPAADAQGNVYFSTSNSDPKTPSYSASYNFPESVVKVSPDLSRVLDSFTPYNYFARDQGDIDFGAGGTMLLPDQIGGVYPHLVVAGGKDGRGYLLNRDALGGFNPNGPNKDLGELPSGPCWCGPAYFVGADSVPRIVTGGANGVTTWRVFDGSSLNVIREGQVPSSATNGEPDNGGTIPAISSNGKTPGSAILWFVQRPNDITTYSMNLRAYDAANLANALFVSSAGNWTNYNSNANAVPTIANGYVYVGSYKQLRIFGLFGH